MDLFSGCCIGIALAMAFYNLFIFFSVKDTLYIYYFAYVACSIWVIAQLNGVWEFYSWHDNAQRHRLCYGECLCIIAIFFTMRFLNTRKDMPYGHYILVALVGLLVIGGFIITVIDFHPFGNKFSQSVCLIAALTNLILGIVSYKRGNKSAKFYVLAWTGLALGSTLTLLTVGGFLPYNAFTANSFTIGTCLENILLGFALANRINIYRDESAKASALALHRLEENELLIKEQNKMLEEKVHERTEALQNTLHQLQSTESQLVQSEKMAALGELTAGIAHEINNPINFISSSIPPLKRDIEALDDLINKYEGLNSDNLEAKLQEISDFKEEIDYDYTKEEIALLLSSITDGTNRTTEIVKGLRNFARLDEADQKRSSINEGLESTILLMQSSFKKKNIQLIKELGDIPNIVCYPGQLNQVFMNILNNAVQAMPEKGTITIKTRFCPETDSIKISLSDTGTGMSEAVKNKIFQPFFTTKDVGEGTGLGLSISYGIVKKHNGTIEVESEEGKGTTFRITLPKGEKLAKQ
jgi:two-component system, NtrC family, sensor kinase